MRLINESIEKIYNNSTQSNSYIEQKRDNFNRLIESINTIEQVHNQLEQLKHNF
jgi:hypothetical protein